jgi:hypothetical protein
LVFEKGGDEMRKKIEVTRCVGWLKKPIHIKTEWKMAKGKEVPGTFSVQIRIKK